MPDAPAANVEPCRCVYPDKCFCPPEAKSAARDPNKVIPDSFYDKPPPHRAKIAELLTAAELDPTDTDAAHAALEALVAERDRYRELWIACRQREVSRAR